MSIAAPVIHRLPAAPSPFASALCGVDATPGSREAMRQAGLLVAEEGRVTSFDLTGETEARQLVAEATGYDLLVLSAQTRSRAQGFLLGSAASYAIHAARGPVLVARSQASVAFPGTVLVGTAGAEDLETVRLAARIAARRGGSVMLAHVGTSDHLIRHALAAQSVLAKEITGAEPVVLSVSGSPVDRLVSMAQTTTAGLLVVGSSGREGIRAIASVSERVAHRASCSVLVTRRYSDPRA